MCQTKHLTCSNVETFRDNSKPCRRVWPDEKEEKGIGVDAGLVNNSPLPAVQLSHRIHGNDQ